MQSGPEITNAWNLQGNRDLKTSWMVLQKDHIPNSPFYCDSGRDVTNVRSSHFSTLHPVTIAQLIMA